MIVCLLLAVTPSVKAFVSSNGYATLQYSLTEGRFDRFMQHPYKFESEGVPSRDLLVDAHFEVPSLGPVESVSYEDGSGIIKIAQHAGATAVTTYGFVPRGLAGPAFVLILEASAPVDVTSVLSTRLGMDRPEPSGAGEYIQYSSLGFEEYGPHNASAAVACSRALPAADARNYPTATNGDDIVPRYEWRGTTSVALLVSYDHGNIAPDAWGRLDDWLAGVSSPAELLQRERDAWTDTAVELPGDMPEEERALYRQSLAIMKMAQVQESGRAQGQILASLAASTANEWNQWNITWVRDMAYATAALAEAGQLVEARDALTFQLQAQAGFFQEFVGTPYQISVCRYYGSGREESDYNQDGPNIEYDGFGLFLWSLDSYYRASADDALLATYWPLIKEQIGDVLVSLIEPYSGLIKADSSIWETHWNGKQRQFAYTSITAAAGLCAAGELAERVGDKENGRKYRNAGRQIRDAILERLVGADNVIASSLEERGLARDYYDAAVVEAIAFGLIDPRSEVAKSTLLALRQKLSSGDGRGLFRNDEGGDYDKQEWVMVNLRTSQAERMAGLSGDQIYDWVVAQSVTNGNVIAELYAADDASYTGSVPMVGFGAGAFVLAANARYGLSEVIPACRGYASAKENEPLTQALTAKASTPVAASNAAQGCASAGRPWWFAALVAWLLIAHVQRQRRMT